MALLLAALGCPSSESGDPTSASEGDTGGSTAVDSEGTGAGATSSATESPGTGDPGSTGSNSTGSNSTGDPGTTDTSSTGDPGGSTGGVGDTSGESGDTTGGPPGADVLKGYWVWEKRVQGDVEQMGEVDKGQQKLAFGTGNDKCHYIWNEITKSDFHTECTYTVEMDMVTFTASADPDDTAAGYSCAHPDWTSWNDRPAVQYGRYKFVGDRLWIGVNTYWGFGGGANGVPVNNSLKRFPFWESLEQATTEESWIVFMPVTREEWYTTYAISTTCQGTPEICAQWPGCGPGDKGYVD